MVVYFLSGFGRDKHRIIDAKLLWQFHKVGVAVQPISVEILNISQRMVYPIRVVAPMIDMPYQFGNSIQHICIEAECIASRSCPAKAEVGINPIESFTGSHQHPCINLR